MAESVVRGAAQGIAADPDLMCLGAARLTRVAEQLAEVTASVRAVPVGVAAAARRDELAASLGRQVIELALVADRVRRSAEALREQERSTEAMWRRLADRDTR